MKELNKIYEPNEVESRIYEMWENGGYFKPKCIRRQAVYDRHASAEHHGTAALGHAFDGTLQDILTRYKRLQGYSALWLPGKIMPASRRKSKWWKRFVPKKGRASSKSVGKRFFPARGVG
jgi:hypothetical protein